MIQRVVRAFVLLLTGALGLAACSGGKDAVDQQAGGQFRYVSATKKGDLIPAASRKKAGDLSGTLLSGGSYQLRQDAGKVVLVNYWASWCGPCQTESPQLDALYRDLKSKGVQFVGIDVKDSKQAAEAFVKDKDITYPTLYDENAKTALELGKDLPLLSLPVTVVLDKQQRAAAVYLGALLPKDLEPALNKLLAET